MKILILVLMVVTFNLYASKFEVIQDSSSGLMWQDDANSISNIRDYEAAIEFCQGYTLAKHDDWRLPTAKELLTITDKNRYNPSIKEEFKYTNSKNYWSSSTFIRDEISAWSVNFKVGGTSSPRDKMSELNVRCVRTESYNSAGFDKLIARLLKKEETDSHHKTIEKNSTIIHRTLEMAWGKAIVSNLEYNKEEREFFGDLSFEANKRFMQRISFSIESRHLRRIVDEAHNIKTEAIFDYDGDDVILKEVTLIYDRVHYPLNFVNASKDDMKVSSYLSNKIDDVGLKNFNELNEFLNKSRRVPKNSTKWLFAIGIEDYEHANKVKYAKRSTELFAKTVQKKLGVSISNSYVLTNSNATKSKMKRKLKEMLSKIKRGDTIFFYFTGHGMIATDLRDEPFLLMSDAKPEYIDDDKFFSLRNIYSKLSYSKANKIVTFMDTEFSTNVDTPRKAIDKKDIARRVGFNKNKMVVLSAVDEHQFASPYNKKGYRLFSYYVIKDIIDGTKHVKGFFKTLQDEAYSTSLKEYGKSNTQKATIAGNLRLHL